MLDKPVAMTFLDQIADLRIAVMVPCLNEEATIAEVVKGFKAAVPSARIYVYDNNCTDNTAAVARAAGAVLGKESRPGKGNVVRRMFSDVDADIYILADGDGTYDASALPGMLNLFVSNQLDFLNGARVHDSAGAYRPGHRFGNQVLTGLVRVVFGRELNDMLSGYKVLSRRFVKSFPAVSSGFEIETELAVHALEQRMPMAEVPTHYAERPLGSASKLRTIRDGIRILSLISRLVKDERPFQFFGLWGLASILLGLLFGSEVVITYLQTGLVPRLPMAVLSLGMIILGVISIFSGLILDMVASGRREIRRMFYLSVSGATPMDLSRRFID